MSTDHRVSFKCALDVDEVFLFWHGLFHTTAMQRIRSTRAGKVKAEVEKGLVVPAALDVLIETCEHKVGPRNGAQVVAKAWAQPEFCSCLFLTSRVITCF